MELFGQKRAGSTKISPDHRPRRVSDHSQDLPRSQVEPSLRTGHQAGQVPAFESPQARISLRIVKTRRGDEVLIGNSRIGSGHVVVLEDLRAWIRYQDGEPGQRQGQGTGEVDRLLVGTPLGEKREAFARSLKKGTEVYVPRFREKAKVRKIDKGGRLLTVLMNGTPVQIGFDDVSWLEEPPAHVDES